MHTVRDALSSHITNGTSTIQQRTIFKHNVYHTTHHNLHNSSIDYNTVPQIHKTSNHLPSVIHINPFIADLV